MDNMIIIAFLVSFAAVSLSVNGQSQTGFISIDCGSQEHFSYQDTDTGINYNSDVSYIDTGVNRNISAEYAYPIVPNLPIPLSDLRSFPIGNKNCYALRPSSGIGSSNLIRATFLYGNYDGQNKLPVFDLYVDLNFWSSVTFRNTSDVVKIEIISVMKYDSVSICLVNKGLGVPFISALELRPLNNSVYNGDFGNIGNLVLFERLNIGSSNGTGRYVDDIYDRIWPSYISGLWDPIGTSLEIDSSGNGYKAPQEVIQTAVTPLNESESLEVYWNASDSSSQFYVYLYFAEFEKLGINKSRKFNVSWNGSPLFGPLVPKYLYADTVSNSKALVGKEHRVSIYKTGDSTLPPILNAVEIFMFKELDQYPTYSEDITAITDIKTTYQVNRSWIGDPCGPRNYSWEGLQCIYNGSNPRIISLNLSSSGLIGEIAASIANLSSIESLDLSNNNLTGSIPGFLTDLQSLKFLVLKGNQLIGAVPASLIKRSKIGILTLSVDDINLCSSNSCKKSKKLVVPLVASISSVLFLLIVALVIWKLRKKNCLSETEEVGKSLPLKDREFSYAAVVNITKNFATTIGEGGFGSVYLGQLENGTQVAVKILSQSSSQGSKEFKAEAELLMRVHHRNLASFVGYCEEGNKMALIYEYMANGDLRDHLAGKKSHILGWERRLQIAIDAAQGLEYLHSGCKPPIIHRDVKTSNILLGEKFEAKIADFGLSRVLPGDGRTHVSTAVMGTRGYLDPEYYIYQKLNEKSDVYSFGIVLLELITGQPAILRSSGEDIHIVQWVEPMLDQDERKNIVDPKLLGQCDAGSVKKALEVAMACTATRAMDRVTMSFVVAELKECLDLELGCDKRKEPREEISVSPVGSTEMSFFTDSEYTMTVPFAR